MFCTKKKKRKRLFRIRPLAVSSRDLCALFSTIKYTFADNKLFIKRHGDDFKTVFIDLHDFRLSRQTLRITRGHVKLCLSVCVFLFFYICATRIFKVYEKMAHLRGTHPHNILSPFAYNFHVFLPYSQSSGSDCCSTITIEGTYRTQ